MEPFVLGVTLMNGKIFQLGHLSKINGMEPAASRLRERFSSEALTVDELNALVTEYIR